MLVKLFGDCTPINWEQLGVRMPFAPMHELAKKYTLEEPYCIGVELSSFDVEHILRTFEIQSLSCLQLDHLLSHIKLRVGNTISALDQCASDTVYINLGGGYHHAGKYPNTGYAYSLINDIIWAVDYQLEQGKTIGIIDLDFHFGGGTAEYYLDNKSVQIFDFYHPKGILQKHANIAQDCGNGFIQTKNLQPIASDVLCPHLSKIILNLGTDWFHDDPIFGKYGNMLSHDILVVWMETIQQIVDRKIPLCITMGGGYGEDGLSLYEHLIDWLTFYQPETSAAL